MAEKAINCFKNYVTVAKTDNENEDQDAALPSVTSFIELFSEHGHSYEEVFLKFFEKFYDGDIKDIEKHQLDFFALLQEEADNTAGTRFDITGTTAGVSKFIQLTGDLEADVPMISEYFGRTLYVLYDLNLINFGKLEWVQKEVGEDDFIMPDINYKILGHFLKFLIQD